MWSPTRWLLILKAQATKQNELFKVEKITNPEGHVMIQDPPLSPAAGHALAAESTQASSAKDGRRNQLTQSGELGVRPSGAMVARGSLRAGIRARTRVPAPGGLWTSIAPPTDSARSRIVLKPKCGPPRSSVRTRSAISEPTAVVFDHGFELIEYLR